MSRRIIVFSLLALGFLNFWFPENTAASGSAEIVTREDVMDVAKNMRSPEEIHGMTLENCKQEHAFRMRGEIRDLLKQGFTKDQVIDKMVDKYGERILLYPEMQGFGLVGWILPGVGVLAGIAIVIGFIRFYFRKPSSGTVEEKDKEVSREEERRLREELKNWM